jgi:hypothetical protein
MMSARQAQDAPHSLVAPLGGFGVLPLVPRLSVIVPATNEPPTLDRALDAITACLGPDDELIVARDPAGAGPAEARNLGADRAAGDVLVFVDADVEIHSDALELIRQRFSADPGLAALFGSYDDSPAAPGTVSNFRNLLHHHVHSSSAGPAETFWAGLGAIRRHTFLEIGGFGFGRYPRPSVEDIELGLRLTEAQLRIELDPRIRGCHLKRWTLTGMVYTDLVHRGIPWTRLLIERREVPNVLNIGWRHRVTSIAALAGVVLLVFGQLLGVAAALVGVLALNWSFYALLARRRGVLEAVLGVGLHLIHQLTAIASIPAGVAVHMQRGLARAGDPRVARRPHVRPVSHGHVASARHLGDDEVVDLPAAPEPV